MISRALLASCGRVWTATDHLHQCVKDLELATDPSEVIVLLDKMVERIERVRTAIVLLRHDAQRDAGKYLAAASAEIPS